jgi:hypothetical protein
VLARLDGGEAMTMIRKLCFRDGKLRRVLRLRVLAAHSALSNYFKVAGFRILGECVCAVLLI